MIKAPFITPECKGDLRAAIVYSQRYPLADDERLVLEMYFGIDRSPIDIDEIAQAVGKRPSRVYQMIHYCLILLGFHEINGQILRFSRSVKELYRQPHETIIHRHELATCGLRW